jgi:ankyrin repeat protein
MENPYPPNSQQQRRQPEYCNLLEALALNDIELSVEIIKDPLKKHTGKICYKEFVPIRSLIDGKFMGLIELLKQTKKRTKNTALHIAAFAGEPTFIKTCLDEMDKQKIDIKVKTEIVNQLNASNDTPLLHAASKGHFECMSLLVERGFANVKHRNKDGLDAFMASTAYVEVFGNNPRYCVDMTRYLFKKGADIETTDSRGRRALHYAVASENMDAVDFLLNEAKVNAAWKDSFGRTALDECVSSSNEVTNPKLMEMLRKGMENSKKMQEELFLQMLEEEEELEEQEKRKKEKKKRKKKKTTNATTEKSAAAAAPAQQQLFEEDKDFEDDNDNDNDLLKDKQQGEEEEEEEEEEGISTHNNSIVEPATNLNSTTSDEEDEDEKENNDDKMKKDMIREQQQQPSAWTSSNKISFDDSSFEVVTSKKKKKGMISSKNNNNFADGGAENSEDTTTSNTITTTMNEQQQPSKPSPLLTTTTTTTTTTVQAKKKTFPNTIIPPTSWFQSATIEFQERYPAAVDLDVTLEHMLGSNLETLSASQLDVIADAHVAALEEIRKHRLRLIQKRLTEQRMIDNENEETNI